MAQAELELAKQTEQQALTRAREIHLRAGEALALFQLGEIALAAGDLAGARRLHEEALAVRTDLKETRTMLESQVALATLTLEEGSADEAARQASQLVDRLGDKPGDGLRLPLTILVARSDLARRNTSGARRTFDEARRMAAETERIDIRRSRWRKPISTWRPASRSARGHGSPTFGDRSRATGWCLPISNAARSWC